MQLFDFDDIVLVPEKLSEISSRSECNPYDDKNFLPLFTAPMDTVVDENNWDKFSQNRIYSIIPRNLNKDDVSHEERRWYSYGLDQFIDMFINSNKHISDKPIYALIDIANGHMNKLYEAAKKAKLMYGDLLVLMVGNIANPKTYLDFAKIGVDYIRLGIGNGAGCLTTQQTGVGYPLASLISQCFEIKKQNGLETKIVADGGFKKYSDIIKALALGADYVMLGSMFNKALESAGELYVNKLPDTSEVKQWITVDEYFNNLPPMINKEMEYNYYLKNGKFFKQYRGMSTKEVQKSWGKLDVKTSEGISFYNRVEYNLEGWCNNLKDYLRSAMSYTDSKTLFQFKFSEYQLITENAFKRYNK